MRKTLVLVLGLTILVTISSPGCNGGVSTPEVMLNEYFQAAREKDVNTVYNLITREDQKDITKEELLAGLEGIAEFEIRIGTATISGDEARIDVTFEASGMSFTYPFVLVKEGGKWKISVKRTDAEINKMYSSTPSEYPIP
jgi:hypothetical protein